jgi:ELWxxDGT repeat protein
MKTSSLRRWCHSLRSAKQTGPASRARRRRQLFSLEVLEDRITLSLTPQMVLDINTNTLDAHPSQMMAIGSTTYFTADDGVHGIELWKSDGTGAGTTLVKDINPSSASSNPGSLTNVNGTLFFSADDGTHGIELWKSDGTAAGTVMLKDIYPGSYLFSSIPRELTNLNGTLFFTAYDPATGGWGLWKSESTAVGTVVVKGGYSSSPIRLTDVNGTLFFTAEDHTGYELWKSDGTAAGTTLVKDIYPGTHREYGYDGSWWYVQNSSNPTQLTNLSGTLFFSAVDGTHGSELWKSDGTAAGTVLLKDINPGVPHSYP